MSFFKPYQTKLLTAAFDTASVLATDMQINRLKRDLKKTVPTYSPLPSNFYQTLFYKQSQRLPQPATPLPHYKGKMLAPKFSTLGSRF